MKGADRDVGLVGRTHADACTPFAHGPVLEALIGSERPIVAADRQRHEIAVERRRIVIEARCETAEGDIDAVVEQLLLAIEPDELRAYAEARAIDLLRLDDRVADIVRAGIAAGAVDDARMRAEARDAGPRVDFIGDGLAIGQRPPIMSLERLTLAGRWMARRDRRHLGALLPDRN